MSTDAGSLRIISSWLANLAKLTRHKQGRLSDEELAALKDERALYASLLGKDLPSGAFTLDSLHYVAQGHGFWPAYEDIRSRLNEWWNENKPRTAVSLPAYAASEHGGLDVMDQKWVDFWHTRKRENYAAMRAGDMPTSRRRLESLIRQQSPRAWAVICQQEGTTVEQHRAATAAEVDYVRSMLTAERTRNQASRQPEPVKEAFPSRPVDPEVLHRARVEAGIVRPES